MKRYILLCLGLMFTWLGSFAEVNQNAVPYEFRLSKQQDFLLGDIVSLDFVAEINASNWNLVSTTPYPKFKSIRPVFAPGESKGIAWSESDLARTLQPVRESDDLSAPLIMDRHELIWSKKFKITAKEAKVTGTLRGEYKPDFGDSLEAIPYELPVSIDIEARDSSVKRWLMKSEKINDVLAVVVTIFVGLIIYVFFTQRKLKKLTALAEEIKNSGEDE